MDRLSTIAALDDERPNPPIFDYVMWTDPRAVIIGGVDIARYSGLPERTPRHRIMAWLGLAE